MPPCFSRFVCLLILCLSLGATAQAQGSIHPDSLFKKVGDIGDYLWNRSHDTSYIQSFRDHLNFKILGINKFTFFRVRDKESGSRISYRPELGLNLGLGITYKWFSMDIGFNVGIREENIPESNFLDFQGVAFSSKYYLEASFKYYYGYQAFASSGFSLSDIEESIIRPDIRTIRLGAQFLYAFNYDKFSLKAPFVFSEIQKKSAGSVIFGASFSTFTLDADSSIIPLNVQDQFHPNLHLQGLNSTNIGISAGYMYSFIVKQHWFATLGFIPGLTINGGDYQTQYREPLDIYLSYQLKTMTAFGYNGPRIFCGLQILGDIDQLRVGKGLPVVVSHGKGKFFFGYRIKAKKK